MKTILKWAAAIGLAACLGTTANAQGFGRGGGFGMQMGGGGGLMLLTNKSVQKELKLSDEQVEKVTKARDEQMQKMRDRREEFQGLEGDELREKMQAIGKEMAAESKKITDEVLKPEQAKRFSQINYQQMGFQAYMDKDIQGKLKITEDQKKKFTELMEESQKDMPTREDFQSDGQAAMKKMTELRDALAKKGADVLTAEQKTTWKEMVGEPFTIVREPMRRPGGAN